MPTRAETATTLLRTRSKLLYGNADRLQVANAIARSDDGLVHAQGLADELGIAPPRVRAQLLALTEAELLETLPRNDRIQYYRRVDDAYWKSIADVVDGWS